MRRPREGVLTREVQGLGPKGTLVYEYLGHTYGKMVGPEHIAVTAMLDRIPFVSVSISAVKWRESGV